MNRVIFLIDGFNLYHSIADIQKTHRLNVKWLNIYNLCSSFLYLIGNGATLEHIYYFSAYAHHLGDANIIKRHRDYITCLESTGITKVMGRFKPKDIRCNICHKDFVKHEEKETDVAISAKLLEVLHSKECETVALMTGDTDIVPAVETARRLFPDKAIIFIFPFNRKNKQLEQIASKSFQMHPKIYVKHQFPDPVILANGDSIYKPSSW